MHLLVLTAGAALASLVPATAPPGAPVEPPQGVVPAGTYTLEDSFAGAPFTVTLTVPEGWTYDGQFNALWGFGETASVHLGEEHAGVHHAVVGGADEPGSRRQLRLEGQ